MMLGKLKRFLAGLVPVGLAGAFFFVIVTASDRAPEDPALVAMLPRMVMGCLFGIGALGLIRLFRVAAWAYPLVGLLVGPFIGSLFVDSTTPGDKWGEIALLVAILGCLVGLIEWARVSRLRQEKFDSRG